MNQAIEARIVRQTEKALLVTIVTARGDQREVWLPKSQIKPEGRVIWLSDWLLENKRREVGGIVTLDRTIAGQMSAGG